MEKPLLCKRSTLRKVLSPSHPLQSSPSQLLSFVSPHIPPLSSWPCDVNVFPCSVDIFGEAGFIQSLSGKRESKPTGDTVCWEGEWKANGRRVEGEWKASGGQMEGKWKADGRQMEGRNKYMMYALVSCSLQTTLSTCVRILWYIPIQCNLHIIFPSWRLYINNHISSSCGSAPGWMTMYIVYGNLLIGKSQLSSPLPPTDINLDPLIDALHLSPILHFSIKSFQRPAVSTTPSSDRPTSTAVPQFSVTYRHRQIVSKYDIQYTTIHCLLLGFFSLFFLGITP